MDGAVGGPAWAAGRVRITGLTTTLDRALTAPPRADWPTLRERWTIRASEVASRAAPTARSKKTGYMPQLDGLRALAAATVILHHFWPAVSEALRAGQVGVPLFFVLSGFLITGILLRCRPSVTGGDLSLGAALRTFYARRSLRIFPLYYLVLTLICLSGFLPVGRSWPWHYAYLSNVWFSVHGPIKGMGHLWSLAVEEQFYLVWPLLVLTVPRNWLLPTFVAAVVSAPLFRACATAAGLASGPVSALTPSALDKLALGALLALVSDPASRLRRWRTPLLRAALVAGLPLAVLGNVLWTIGRAAPIASALQPLGGALVFTWLVGRAADGFAGILGRLLAWRPVVYMGTISYGIYVYHALMPHLFAAAHLSIPNPHLRGAAMTAAALSLAAVSFHLFESPINQLKRYFVYSPRSEPAHAPLRIAPQPEPLNVLRPAA